MFIYGLILACAFSCAFGRPNVENNEVRNHEIHFSQSHTAKVPTPGDPELTADHWNNLAKLVIDAKVSNSKNTGVAKNVIMFLGDGMSIPTLAAARTHLGQRQAKNGEETQLSFEKFPYTGLSKTYCVDRQVADSACSATAYLCGVKANEATLGVTASVQLKDCMAMKDTKNHVQSIARQFQLKGKRTGIVTTTRITHASPAGVYAHSAFRDWESDTDVVSDGVDPSECHDIAQQLIHGDTGKELNVILGGGSWAFLPKNKTDEDGLHGQRSDGRDLIAEWQKQKANAEKSYRYVSNTSSLKDVPEETEYVLGLFANDHMDFNLDRVAEKQPSLKEMTETAIKILSQGSNGYFLFVEGGRIDQAHHKAQARKALDETIEFHKAIEEATRLTDTTETLIVVTSDHAHTMSINGYPERGNDILGIGGNDDDMLPFTTLTYANGPGHKYDVDGHRYNISQDNITDKNYAYPGLFPRSSESHGGDDVAIFARGPWAHLLTGVLEQNVIAHVMAYAACLTEDCKHGNSAGNLKVSMFIQITAFLLAIRQIRHLV